MCRFWFFPHSIIALNKQHDIQCFYLIKIMSKSKTQMTTAEVMLNHPNAWFSWLKPAAAIEATISTLTDGARTHCLVQSLSPSHLSSPSSSASPFMTKSLCLEVLIFFEHPDNNNKTHHGWVFYWLINSQKNIRGRWTLTVSLLSQYAILFAHQRKLGFCILYNDSLQMLFVFTSQVWHMYFSL